MKDNIPADVRVKWAEIDKQLPRAKIFEILEEENRVKKEAKQVLKEIPELIAFLDEVYPSSSMTLRRFKEWCERRISNA